MQPTTKNDALHELLTNATGIAPQWTTDVRANCFGWLKLTTPSQLRDAAKALAGKVRLCTVTAYAEERDDMDKRRSIAYHFADKDTVITVTVPIYDPQTMQKLPVPSITPWFRNADWNEREFREMYNIDIQDHPNPKRLFLDERLDAGIMTRLIPFSAMANSAGTNTLWERILEAKGVPPEERLPSLAVPSEPIKLEPKVTPVALPDKGPGAPTLAAVAATAEEAVAARTEAEGSVAQADAPTAEQGEDAQPVKPEAEKAVASEKQAAAQPAQVDAVTVVVDAPAEETAPEPAAQEQQAQAEVPVQEKPATFKVEVPQAAPEGKSVETPGAVNVTPAAAEEHAATGQSSPVEQATEAVAPVINAAPKTAAPSQDAVKTKPAAAVKKTAGSGKKTKKAAKGKAGNSK